MSVQQELSGRATVMRFAVVGVVATAVHYATLLALLHIVGVPSAGLANGLASVVGIATSYLGNRIHTFRSAASHAVTLPRFLVLYWGVAALHAAGLALWADLMGWSVHIGFMLVTGLCVGLTFIGNRRFVFERR